MNKPTTASYIGGLKMTTAAQRTGHIIGGLRQQGSTKSKMWMGGLKNSAAQTFSLKMKKISRGR